MSAGVEALEQGGIESGGTDGPRPSWPRVLCRWAIGVPWLWPALLTLLICGYQLGRPLLWRDELYSWTFAVDPVHDTIASTAGANPAQLVYNVFLHYWISAFGDSVTSMRLPSVLCMGAAAAIVTLIGRRVAGTSAGLAAGIVFALLPSVARFGQEARFYAPELLAAAVALLFLLRALDAPSIRRWTGYALALAACGYLDIVAFSMLAGHIGVVAVDLISRGSQPAVRAQPAVRTAAGFGLAALAGVAACLPVILPSLAKSHSQVGWLARPDASLSEFSFFARNLFFSTSVAAIVVLLSVLAWLAWRPAALMTAMALLPPIGVWLLSQGPDSYFFPRYLQFTVVAWAVLAGIGLSRVDKRVLAAGLVLIAVCAAGDQRVIREAGAHDWATYPVGTYNGYYRDFSGPARYIGRELKPSDGIAYPSGQRFWQRIGWQMIGPGVQYYLRHSIPAGTSVPHEEFVAGPGTQVSQMSPVWCGVPAACFGNEPRVWVVGANGGLTSPDQALLPSQAAVLRQHYRVIGLRRFEGVTVFLLERAG